MKFVIVLCALIALASAEDFKLRSQEDLMKVRKECFEATKVPADHIEKFKMFDFPDDEVTRCYIACIFEKFQLFSPSEGFKTENMIAQFGAGKKTKEELLAEVQSCADKNEQKSDTCTWVFRGFKCFISKNLPLVQQTLQQKN